MSANNNHRLHSPIKGLTWAGLRPIFACAATALARVTLTRALSRKGLTGVGLRLNSRPQRRAYARRTLILAFFHEGLTGVGLRPWERWRLARRAALARGAPSS